jgi:hypothetical protein
MQDPQYLVLLDGKTSAEYSNDDQRHTPHVAEFETADGKTCQTTQLVCDDYYQFGSEQPSTVEADTADLLEAYDAQPGDFLFTARDTTEYVVSEWQVDGIYDLTRLGGDSANRLRFDLEEALGSEVEGRLAQNQTDITND